MGWVRIAIVGNSGSGKTTLARRVVERTGAHHVEIDALFHQPGWTPKDRDLLRSEMIATLDEVEDWVVDGNYDSSVGDIVRGRAETIVVFDLPRARVMRQVITRTVRRAITRAELWNGNREPLTNFYRWDPERNVIRWSWVKHDEYRQRYRARMADGSWDHAEVVVVRSRADAAVWLESLPVAPTGPGSPAPAPDQDGAG